MIHKRLFVVSQLVVALFLCPLSGAFAQESDSGQAEEGSSSDRKPGITVIVDAAGAVQIIDKPGAEPRPAKKGDQIPVEGTVVTGPGAQVNLALSNGAFFQILENSSFSIAQFEQTAYEFVFSNGAAIQKKEMEEFGADEAVLTALDASEEAWNELPSEPTESNANFALNYGTMIGESKKLKAGSTMEITTPIGVAGIRGTIWRFTIQPVGGAGSNRFRGNLDVSTGRVDFRNREGTRSVQVQGGFGMNVNAVIQGGVARLEGLATAPLTAERQQLLNSTMKEVSNVQEVFSAIQGNPDIIKEAIRTISAADPNNPQAVADAALSLLNGDAGQAKLVAEVATAIVITRAAPEIAPTVISEVVSSMVTQAPNLAPNIVNGVVAASTNAANRNLVSPATSQNVNRAAVDTAISSAPGQADAIRNVAETTEADRPKNQTLESGDATEKPQVNKPSEIPNTSNPPPPPPLTTPAPTPAPTPVSTPLEIRSPA